MKKIEMPYPFSDEQGGTGKLSPNLPSPEGEALGAELARFAAPKIAETKARFPDSIPPCSECAFVKGTAPNRCLSTVGDALKCVVELVPFNCHKGDGSRLCAGWAAMMTVPEEVKLANSAPDSATVKNNG